MMACSVLTVHKFLAPARISIFRLSAHGRYYQSAPYSQLLYRKVRQVTVIDQYFPRHTKRRTIQIIHQILKLLLQGQFNRVAHQVLPLIVERTVRPIDLTATNIVTPSTTRDSDNG